MQPIIQYGLLVYGCTSYNNLKIILNLQKKILKFIYFRNRRESCNDIFEKNQILTVYELHLYELLKFVLRSINNLHKQEFLNDLFFAKNSRITRLTEPGLPSRLQNMMSVYSVCVSFLYIFCI